MATWVIFGIIPTPHVASLHRSVQEPPCNCRMSASQINSTVTPFRWNALRNPHHWLSTACRMGGFSGCVSATAINFRSSGSKPSNAGSVGNSWNSVSELLIGVIGTKSHRPYWFLKTHRRNLSPAPGSPVERRFCMYSPRISTDHQEPICPRPV